MLSLLVWHALVGAGLLYIVPNRPKPVMLVSIMTALVGMVAAAFLTYAYDSQVGNLQFIEQASWIPVMNASYYLAVDGISVAMILLTTLTTLVICLMGQRLVAEHLRDYMAVFLLMQTMIIGVFCAQDALLFFLFWEGSLIPMYLCIGIWGSKQRAYAAKKFFIYTFLGSTLLLISVVYLGVLGQTFELTKLAQLPLGLTEQVLLFLAFLLAFAIKVPMFPVHTWLPDAHTEAPTGGSVLLAALLLKVGAYGFIRFSMPITPDAAALLAMPIVVLSLIAIVYVGLIALAQTDMKKLIAYSSVAHMGFVTLGMFGIYLIPSDVGALAFNGAMIQMISHAFGSGAMFLAFGMIYARLHTRAISDFGGLTKQMPYLAAFFMIFSMANVGLPGTAGFVGEILVLVAFLKTHFWIAATAGLTLIISASYTLWMYRQVFFGPVTNELVASAKDICFYEKAVLTIMVLGIFFLGLYPKPLGDLLSGSSTQVMVQATHYKLGAEK